MALGIFIILAFVIIIAALHFTTRNKLNRITVGVVMILSVLMYPLSLPILFELELLEGVDGAGCLIIFYLMVLVGGIITIIAGIFTKTKSIDS